MKPVKITCPTPDGRPGEFMVDGQPVAGVTGFRLTGSAKDVVRLELDLAAHPFEFEGEAHVRISDEVRDTLIRFGWTPPPHA